MELLLAACLASGIGSLIARKNDCLWWIVFFAGFFILFRIGSMLVHLFGTHRSVFTLRFARNLFLRIHADFTMLFVADTTIGMVIGYYSNNTLLGLFAGGMWWLFDYELISRKLLRLNPIH